MSDTVTKQKIAVLGGGLGAMTTVFELTNVPNWQDKYEITVYQLGWRLGGKGASGRGPCSRIEEHGLHIWMGFYENAFRMMRQAYAELNRPPEAPLATVEQAFKAHSYILVEEHIQGQWRNWGVHFPTSDEFPGDPDNPRQMPTLWEYITKGLEMLEEELVKVTAQNKSLSEVRSEPGGWLQSLLNRFDHDVADGALSMGHMMLRTAIALIKGLPADPLLHLAIDHNLLVQLLDKLIHWLWEKVAACLYQDDELRHFWIIADMAVAMIKGVLADGVLFHAEGLDILDRWDFREWLQKHGASQVAYESGVVQGLYDLVFAYNDGDASDPVKNGNFAAGAALRSVLRIDFTYTGAIFWKMQASMGDTVFTPIHQVLKKRGVQFKFFHRIKNLALSVDKKSVASISLARQVDLKPGIAEYDPYIECKGLDCWPDRPNYDQLVQGEALKESGENLESFWTKWDDADPDVELLAGKDFDHVVLGIAIGSFPYLCQELIAANVRWQNMVNNVKTVRTVAMQLWLKNDLAALGWTDESPVLDAYVEAFNTWADMTYLGEREEWPRNNTPKNIAYYCGSIKGDIPPQEESDFPAKIDAQVRASADAWLQKNSGYLWPNAAPQDNPGGLDYALLVAPHGGEPAEKFQAQFFRANVSPSERYVISVKGSTQYRLRADESGFLNLTLTGDWIRNGLNIGCVEATVMSGMQAANAITGYPALEDIIGHFHA